jgi:pantetheine-phosphate adenylyltransferase
MKRIAIFPGSFDPFTVGHEEIVKRALPLFDKIIIAVGYNSVKHGFFTPEQRINWIAEVFKNEPKIETASYTGLTVDFCKEKNAKYILRGLRTAADFEYERAVGQMNREIYDEIETVFLLTSPQYSMVSSTIVREILRYGGDVSKFIPQGIDGYKDL